MAEMSPIAVAVLAGGLGTRLRSVVADRPKVLAEVQGRPFLAILLDQLRAAGIEEVILLTGFGADQVRETFGETYHGMRLLYSAERTPLGTAGALRRALPLLRAKTILLLNGDSTCEIDFGAFRRIHESNAAQVSMTVAWVDDVSRYGQVRLDDAGKVVGFAEKGGTPRHGWINAGVYLIERHLLKCLPVDRPMSLEQDLLPDWVAAGNVHAHAGGRFIDIGTPESYRCADTFFDGEPEYAGAASQG